MLVCLLGPVLAAQAATARVIKVLPHYLDQEGRQSLDPSLFERDAYQALLQKKPELRSAMRFDVQWQGQRKHAYTLRLEARGGRSNGTTTQARLEAPVTRSGWFSQWSAVTLKGEEFKAFGDLVAWRMTLWDGPVLVGEQTSFLW